LAGYSGTPLPKKLGLKEDGSIVLIGAPASFARHLAPLPAGAQVVTRTGSRMGLVLFFATGRKQLESRFVALAAKLDPAGMLWVAWPKQASGVATDLNEAVVREVGLAAGLVDNKVCAIDEVWSGLRFQYRLKDRPGA
jgi:hypothetical protein